MILVEHASAGHPYERDPENFHTHGSTLKKLSGNKALQLAKQSLPHLDQGQQSSLELSLQTIIVKEGRFQHSPKQEPITANIHDLYRIQDHHQLEKWMEAYSAEAAHDDIWHMTLEGRDGHRTVESKIRLLWS